MPWVDEVKGILMNFMPGEQGGNAIVDVLSGDYNPSGRLPCTVPTKDNELDWSVL